MSLDFTLSKYRELCDAISKSNIVTLTVKDYITSQDLSDNFVILRHDVDRKLEHALKMAKIENEYNITSTYYFRTISDVFKPDIIKAINNMGHEVGYHYEVLDKADGDFDKAIKIFEEELGEFRKICDVKTVCMHGNPLSKWTNKDLWKKYGFKDFGIIGEPYLSIDYEKVFYLTDTGRAWNKLKFSVKDVVDKSTNHLVEKIKNTDDIINLIEYEKLDQICILTHPNRWSDCFSGWLKEMVWQNIKNVGKAGIAWYRGVFS